MPAANEEAEDIIVVGKVTDDGQCALWDRHPLHPANYEQRAGEVFISDMRPYSVQRTRGVQQKLGERVGGNRVLQELSRDADRSKRLQEHEDAQRKRDEQREEMLEQAQGNAVLIPPSPSPVVAAPVVPVTQTPPDDPDATETGDAGSGDGGNTAEAGGRAPVARPARRGERPPER